MGQVAMILGIAATGIALLGGFARFTIWGYRKLNEIESHTKQLTTNGGGHLADVVRATQATVEVLDAKWDEEQVKVRDEMSAQQDKVLAALDDQQGKIRAELDEQQEKVRGKLESQAEKVATALEKHSEKVDSELKDVWRTLATRDIFRAAEHLGAVVERAEAASDEPD